MWQRLGVCLALATALTGCSTEPADVAELSGPTMGTAYRVQLSPSPDRRQLAIVQLRIDEQLRQTNAVFSTYIDDSAITRFNRSTSTDWQDAPHELVELVSRAETISRKTDGRYDITIGPLVRAWGFGPDEVESAPPSNASIEALKPAIGFRKLAWQSDPPMLKKEVPGLEIDLSSIAKGWAVDQVSKVLEAQGIADYLVDIGGETLARGHKSNGEPWRIAVERPGHLRSAQGAMDAFDIALATSGDYRNFFEHEGRRYSHAIDPLTGQSVRHRLASVTVLADTVSDADAWATALLVLGDEAGPRIAEEERIAALFLLRDGEGFLEQTSTEFDQRVEWTRLQ